MLQARLLDVAIDHFGRFGFGGAATRDIARDAGTAMSSITYHFGGKEGLCLACADHIAAQIKARQAPVFEQIGDPATLTRAQAIDQVLRIIDSFAAMMIHPSSQGWARFIVREQQEPTEAFERLWDGVMRDMLDTSSKLLARIYPQMGGRERRAQVMLMFGQTMVLRSARASLCRALDITELGEAESVQLRAQIRRNTLAILTGETD